MKKIVGILLVVFTLSSCKLGTSGMWRNDRIKEDKREQIKFLNEKLCKAIQKNDSVALKALMSQALLDKGSGNITQLLSQISSSFQSGYRVLDEYNVQNSTTGLSNTLISGVSGYNDYVVNYQAMNDEMYTSLLVSNSSDNEILILIVYGKYEDQWKINILQLGSYSLFNKTAPDFYKIALEKYQKNYLVDAVDYIGLSLQYLKPASDFFHYQKETEIKEFYDKVMKEVNSKYKFPLTLVNINTKPQVFRIYPEMIEGDIFPAVCYVSTVKLSDVNALKAENEQLRQEVYKLFPGINKDKKAVLYAAFNEIPKGPKAMNYRFVDKVND